MKLRPSLFIVLTLLLTLSLSLSACGVGEATATPYAAKTAGALSGTAGGSDNAPAAQSQAQPQDQKQPAVVTLPAKSKEYLPAYGCLPAITITDTVIQACLDKPEPTQYDTLQITTRMSKDGLPIAGAPVKTTWNYRTVRSECSMTSNDQGLGFCSRNIGSATLGFRVVVEVQYDYNGQGYRGETSFIPARAGVAPVQPTQAPVPTAGPAVKTAPPVQPASAGVQFTSVRGGSPGGYASVSVQTAPGASCSITYYTPKGTNSVAAGLVDRNANGAGIASWSWKIGTNTYPGTGEVDVTCNGATASTSITIS